MDEKKKYRLYIVSGSIVLGLVIAGIIYTTLKSPRPLSKEELAAMSKPAKLEYITSDRFGKLDDNQKEQVIKDMNPGKNDMWSGKREMSKDDLKKLKRNMQSLMKKKINEHFDKFFKLSEAERNKILDQKIAAGERFQKKSGEKATRKTKVKSGDLKTGMSTFLEESDSDFRAKMAEYIRQLEAREKVRK
jgi:uncharacterized protein (DUF342 family)